MASTPSATLAQPFSSGKRPFPCSKGKISGISSGKPSVCPGRQGGGKKGLTCRARFRPGKAPFAPLHHSAGKEDRVQYGQNAGEKPCRTFRRKAGTPEGDRSLMAYAQTFAAQGTAQKRPAPAPAFRGDGPPAAYLFAGPAVIAGGTVHTQTPRREPAQPRHHKPHRAERRAVQHAAVAARKPGHEQKAQYGIGKGYADSRPEIHAEMPQGQNRADTRNEEAALPQRRKPCQRRGRGLMGRPCEARESNGPK